MKSILFVVAHPDDVAGCAGGTAILLRKKYALHVACATKGERGCPDRWSMAKTAAIREKEEAAACRMLGASLTFLGQIDAEVFASREACEQLAGIIRKLRPAAVFTLWPIDAHPDHAAVSIMARKAMKLAGSKAELVFFEAYFRSQASQFDPDMYVDITSVIERKMALVRCHRCQNVRGRLEKGMREQNSFRGGQAGVPYAEGFKTVRPWRNTSKSVLASL
ncbi:MAG: PIG-L deacetylase family protein [Phycisphaerae bacterium]